MAYPPVKKPDVRHVDARGKFVSADDPAAAFQVNMDDPGAHNYIEQLKGEGDGIVKAPLSVGDVARPGVTVTDLGLTSGQPAKAVSVPKPK